MGPIDDALEEAFFPELFFGEEVSANLRKILGDRVKYGGLCLPDPQLWVERTYNTSK